MYLSLTSALDGGGWLVQRPGRFTPGDAGWMGPMAVLDGCGKSPPHRDSIPRSFQPVVARCHGLREQHSSFVNVNEAAREVCT